MYAPAIVSGGRGQISVVYSKPSGSLFPIGITNVSVTARDKFGASASCAFDVSVNLEVPPPSTDPGPVPPPPPPPPPPPSTSLLPLQLSDLNYRGMVRYPADSSYLHLAVGTMCIRYVGTERHVLMTNTPHDGVTPWQLSEWKMPTTYGASADSAPDMAFVRAWNIGDVVSFPPLVGDDIGPSFNGWMVGGCWVDPQGVLWTVFYPYYSRQEYPMLSAAVLHDDGTAQRYGPWYYRHRPNPDPSIIDSAYKRVAKWIGPVPSALSSAAGGRSVYLGGDMMSIGGDSCVGPCVIAVKLPALTDNPATTVIEAGVPLMAFNTSSGLPTPDYYATREADYRVLGHVTRAADGSCEFAFSDTYGPFPNAAHPYWQGSQDYMAALLLIQTSTREGVFGFGRRAVDDTWYGTPSCGAIHDASAAQGESQGPHASRYEHALYLWRASDLRSVAAGAMQPWQPTYNARMDPGAQWNIPDFVTPWGAPDGGKVFTPGGGSTTGVFDPLTNQILVQLPMTNRPWPYYVAVPTIQVIDLP